MIEMAAVVLRVEGDRVLVRVAPRAGGCGRCNEPGGCGSAKLANPFAQESAEFWFDNRIKAVEGDRVMLCLPESASLHAALRGYLVPVLGIVAGAAMGVFLAGASASDLHALAGGLLGLAGGVVVSRMMAKTVDAAEPELRRHGADDC